MGIWPVRCTLTVGSLSLLAIGLPAWLSAVAEARTIFLKGDHFEPFELVEAEENCGDGGGDDGGGGVGDGSDGVVHRHTTLVLVVWWTYEGRGGVVNLWLWCGGLLKVWCLVCCGFVEAVLAVAVWGFFSGRWWLWCGGDGYRGNDLYR
ncbi:Hypothetical predicted protein [Olea europaea subsp. europaea]|uniref:Transmembrane protein n=1 Tax=Olea europaea subsp. europaea TaxID=158383 RepID=A0A8S0UIB0_OLEEU|nr:Hypothetical predicted protein [Olea europaea subsp. europaea]